MHELKRAFCFLLGHMRRELKNSHFKNYVAMPFLERAITQKT